MEHEPGKPSRYVPLTRREERLRRVLRSVPVVLLALAAFVLERPWLIAGALAWGLGVVIVTRLHARALNGRLKALAGTLARDGDPSLAARSLEAIVADARGYPGFHCVALLFLGIARARGGDADGALELLYVVQKAGWLSHRTLWMAWLLPWLSQLHAARNELDLAEQWLEVARTSLPAEKREVLVSPESLVALRRGKNEEAIAAIDAYIGSDDASDPVREHFALLRAFAHDRAGHPLADDAVRPLVKSRLASPGRALPLEKWWDEFAAYLERHAPLIPGE
ncbi:MAG TPA: hypothetical protein VIJ22_14470 [Polyangiaceae bacterium]